MFKQGLAILLILSAAVACKPGLLPNSTVEDTSENRQLASVVESYRLALEAMDMHRVGELCSAEYFEDSGTADPSDDYGFDGLMQHLEADFSKVKQLRVNIRLHRVNVDGDRAYVDYRYQIRSLVGLPSQDQWITRTDDNRLSFKSEGGRWKVVAGL